MAIMDPDDEQRQQELAQDNSTPFSLPDDVPGSINDTQPAGDTNVDSQEEYDEGVEGAIEATDLGNRGVLEYKPPQISKEKSHDPHGLANKKHSVPEI